MLEAVAGGDGSEKPAHAVAGSRASQKRLSTPTPAPRQVEVTGRSWEIIFNLGRVFMLAFSSSIATSILCCFAPLSRSVSLLIDVPPNRCRPSSNTRVDLVYVTSLRRDIARENILCRGVPVFQNDRRPPAGLSTRTRAYSLGRGRGIFYS